MSSEPRGHGWINPADWTAQGDGLVCPRWYALVSSRLGRQVERRRDWFRLLMRGVLRARRDGAALLVVERTAAAPWVQRAAELLDVPVVRVQPRRRDDRDTALVGLADRVFALWVRRGGNLQRLLQQRLSRSPAETLWTAITGRPDCGGAELVRSGAVGWFAGSTPATEDSRLVAISSPPPRDSPVAAVDDVPWDEFLVHCTRARDGPLPGQTPAQWRDEVLLGGDDGRAASAVDVLVRILRDGWIHGGSSVTRGHQRVVCLADVPLPELLSRRTFRPHLGRWDYEPYGVAVRRQAIQQAGGQPVIYGRKTDCRRLPPDQQWRFQSVGNTFDWTPEREWRLRGSLDLSSLAPGDAVVFVGDAAAVGPVAAVSAWPIVVWSGHPS